MLDLNLIILNGVFVLLSLINLEMSFFMVDYSYLLNDSVFDELSERKARLTKEKCDSVREANDANLRARSYGLRGALGIPGLVAELWAPIYVFANLL